MGDAIELRPERMEIWYGIKPDGREVWFVANVDATCEAIVWIGDSRGEAFQVAGEWGLPVTVRC